MDSKKKVIVLLSGGIDSTTTLAIVKSLGYAIYALSFDYGQRHNLELIRAAKIAKEFNTEEHLVFKIDLRLVADSALTSQQAVPKERTLDQINTGIPATYVPARNLIFLSIALSWAETIDAQEIYIGTNAIDYSGYPDCRPQFIETFQKCADLATKVGVEKNGIKIVSPLSGLTKSEIIQKGIGLDVNYGLTHSCYDPSPEGLACGKCDSCILRKRGFDEAGIEDPIGYIC